MLRKGKDVLLASGYVRSRTLILLIGPEVARSSQIITALVDLSNSQNRHDEVVFLLYTPIPIIECASMPDQRLITSQRYGKSVG